MKDIEKIPQYKCHKIVCAFEIGKIESYTLFSVCGRYSAKVGMAYVDAQPLNKPGYYVRYENGYESWSPKAVFEAGYTLIDDTVDPMDVESVAAVLYENYCESVGGKAFNNDPLPSWEEFRADPEKKKQSDAWISVARKLYTLTDSLLKANDTKFAQEYPANVTEPDTGSVLFDPTPFIGPKIEIPEGTNYDLAVKHVAIECHEANKRYCESIGDTSQPAWEDAPDWQKESIINGVKFHVANPGADASASHENWLKEKEADGWKYGPEKNPEKKEHPCFVPYAELSDAHKNKDTFLMTVVGQYRSVLADSYSKATDGAE